LPTKRLIAIVAAALLAAPAFATAAGPPGDPGSKGQANGHRPATTQADPPGPDAPAATKGRAYGRVCRHESRKHIPGQKGTPFSQCVTAMAKLATGKTSNPARACAHLSKEHVRGQAGTPYSKCVAAAAKLRSEPGMT
jgi:hypothetical protein